MRLNIATRIFIAVFLIITLMIAAIMAATQLTLRRGFANYVSELHLERVEPLRENLEQIYALEGGWTILQKDPRRWSLLLRQAEGGLRRPPPRMGPHAGPPADGHRRPLGPPPGPPPLPPPPPPPGGLLPLLETLALLSADGVVLVGKAPGMIEGQARRPILHNGQAVGFLVVSTPTLSSDVDKAFFRDSSNALYVVSAAGLLLSLLAAFLLARHFGTPLRKLAGAARQLARGDYSPRLHSTRSDEIGSLLRDFDQLSQALGALEESRRNFVADSSHELRTPLAVLRAQIEALQDGVYVADEKLLRSMHQQVLLLSKLVDDLHDLARADAGALAFNKQSLDLVLMIEEALASFAARYKTKNITCQTDLVPNRHALVVADPDRIRQLLTNLLENSLRYTETGGVLRISLRSNDTNYRLIFEDSVPGVDEYSLTHLFDRFYRSSRSRERESGGSGLGLSICKSIVEAHGGHISASASRLGGLSISVELPAQR